MQAAEKVTKQFVLKLFVLFVLLFTGVLLKPSKLAQPVDAQNLQDLERSTISKQDTQQVDPDYFQLVDRKSNSTGSI